MALLRRAVNSDIPKLIAIEKKLEGLKIYSAEVDPKEWEDDIKNGIVYIIEKNGVPVGDVSYEVKSKDHIYISGIAIVPEFQKQGIAKEALVAIKKEIAGVKRVDLVTHPKNNVILLMALSAGFKIESWKDDFYGDGEPRLVLSLVKK